MEDVIKSQKEIIREELSQELRHILGKFHLSLSNIDIDDILVLCCDDLACFAKSDPSSHNDMIYIFRTFVSYRAVFLYRIAHKVYLNGKYIIARKISEYAKLKTGVEIHPACTIGKRFVLDHGVGTVIGETTVIGDDCYILQMVILGSRHIAFNSGGSRHPRIGNNVEIGGNVRIYGNVHIGDNVVISPGAVIKNSIPDNSKVIVAAEYQVQRGQSPIIYTGYSDDKSEITVFFKNTNLREYKFIELYNGDRPVNIIIEDSKIKFIRPRNSSNDFTIIFNRNETIDIRLR